MSSYDPAYLARYKAENGSYDGIDDVNFGSGRTKAPLSPAEIAQARNWITTQQGGDGSLPGYGNPFGENGVYDPSNTQRNWAVLGAGQAMGYGADELSQILGQTAGDITAMQQQYAPQVGIQADIFRSDNPMVGQPAPTNPYPVAQGGNAGGNFGGTNPYLMQIAEGMQTQANNNLQRNILPGIRGNAVATGGVGGSRQGLAEGMAIGDTQAGLSSALGNLFGTDWQGSQNRALSQYGIDKNAELANRGMDQSYMLGEGNLNLARQGQELNFWNQNRALDQSGAMTGANIYQLANQGDWTGLLNSSNIFNQTAGNNVMQTNSSQQGGGLLGGLGGAGAGYQFYRGLFGGQP